MPTLHLHGPPLVVLDDGRTLPLAAREAALLAWLHGEGATPRARIAGLLWPAGTEAQARANLRQTLARLRRAAGELLADADGLLRLQPALRVAEPAPGAALLGLLAFDDAPEFAAWLEARRDAERRALQRQQVALAQAALQRGDGDAALAAADAVLALQPESEEAWRVRMQVYAQRGDRAAALQAWDDCRHALRAAFGVAPSPETQALGRQLLDDEALAAAGAEAAAAGGLPAALQRPPRLVGRDDALAALQQALALGHGALLLGPGGIGKTRLLAELARRNGPALAVGARPGDAAQPGALLERLVAGALRRFDPVLDAATRGDLERLAPQRLDRAAAAVVRSAPERQGLLHALRRLLAACRGTGVRLLLVDDLHFADEPSLEALHALLGAWRDAPPDAALLPVLAARDDEAGPAARSLLDLLAASGRAARVELTPLDADALHRLLDALGDAAPATDRAGLAAALHARVGGNPAFVLESLKALWLEAGMAEGGGRWSAGRALPLPATLHEAVRRRLQRLSPEALQLAQLAAVAQGDFSLSLAAAASGRAPLALAPLLAELAAAQVFDGQAFVHDLVAEAVRQSLPAALPAALHRLVAEHLATRAAAAGRVAHHLVQAGDAAAAVPWQLAAGDAARARWQMAAAAASYEAAGRTLAPPGGAAPRDEDTRLQALRAWRDAARCWSWASRHEAAEAALRAAEPLARGVAEQAPLQVLRTQGLFNRHRYGEALAAAAQMTAMLPAAAASLPPLELAWAARVVAQAVPHGAPVAAGLALLDTLQQGLGRGGATAADDEVAEARGLFLVARAALLHWDAQPLPAVSDLDAAWAIVRRRADPGAELLLLNLRMRVRHALGDLDGARADGEALLPLARRLEPGAMFVADTLHVLGMVELAAGRPAVGRARLQAHLDTLAGAALAPTAMLRISMALAATQQGRLDEAAQWLGEGPGGATALLRVFWLLARARLAQRREEPAAAQQGWRREAAAVDGLSPALQLQRAVGLASLAALDREPVPGELAPDLEALVALHARCVALGMRGFVRVAALAAAARASAEARHDEALAWARRALAAGDAVDGWVDEKASAWVVAGRVLAAAGQADEARRVRDAGRAWVEQAAAGWGDDAAARSAWCGQHPLHAELLRAG